MSDKCPNCGSGEWIWHANLSQHRCSYCGAWWYKAECTFVPTRSRPDEVLELPDVDDYWWYRKRPTDDWITGRFGPSSNRGLGQYVRAVPPIVAPAKPEPDPDAEWLRYRGMCIEDCTRFSRIADDLERLKREAKEAGR